MCQPYIESATALSDIDLSVNVFDDCIIKCDWLWEEGQFREFLFQN